jgi:hypothetical protein
MAVAAIVAMSMTAAAMLIMEMVVVGRLASLRHLSSPRSAAPAAIAVNPLEQ